MEKRLIQKSDVIAFFNKYSASWDDHQVDNKEIINLILDNAHVNKDSDVLDVACGTGVLFESYFDRNVKSLMAIDISDKMIEIAKKKFKDCPVDLICDDIETHLFDKKFDVIMIYNALPHFTDAELLIQKTSLLLKEGGVLSIAHGMSREKLNEHHFNVQQVSNILPSIQELENIFNKYLKVELAISNDKMYQIVGRK